MDLLYLRIGPCLIILCYHITAFEAAYPAPSNSVSIQKKKKKSWNFTRMIKYDDTDFIF